MSPIRFGTDGWRALIAGDFTFANVGRVARATASFWRDHPSGAHPERVIIGYDRRFLSDRFARHAAEIFAARGFLPVLTSVPTPTPAVSLAVKSTGAAGGIIITASHNPAVFNGFKIKNHLGAPGDADLCKAIESRIQPTDAEIDPAAGSSPPGIRVRDLRPAHYRALTRLVDFKAIARSRLCVAHDALFGVGAGCFASILEGTSCKVTTLNGAHDPYFGGINPEPIPANYRLSAPILRGNPHDVCLVTDGDADRIGAMDGRGRPLSTHDVICLLLEHWITRRQGRGRVVKALTTTSMVDRICAAHGVPLVETRVGFKYIAAEMIKGDVLLGFEESGGIGFPGHIPERDGILAGLALLEVLAINRRDLRSLLQGLRRRYGPHHYGRTDMPLPPDRCGQLMELCRRRPPHRLLTSPVERVDAFDGTKFTARDGSWLMLRGSGTEPLLRIYAEAATPERVRRLLALGRRISRQP